MLEPLPVDLTVPEFARVAIEDNPAMESHLLTTTRNLEPLSRFETAEELVTFLIPSSDSLE
jgi:hypothetical protein